MNLHSHRSGLQFFFLTFCVEGRRPVLSRLVEGEKRPVLLPAGEAVKAVWRSVHGQNAALTASDYVIMPDHVHLLLIVNFDKDPGFSPLVFCHWFMGESERAIATMDGGSGAPAPLPKEVGGFSCGAPAPLPKEVGGFSYGAPAPLPKEVGGFSYGAPAPLPKEVGGFSYDAPAPLPKVGSYRYPAGGAGAKSPSLVPTARFWERGFWLDLSFSSRQLAAIRRYIRLNPARALWKAANPDMFVCHTRFRHRVLDPSLPWSACGDMTILGTPFLIAVSLTRKKSLAEHEAEIAALVEKAAKGWVIVCGFLSPGEKELYRRLRELPHSRWIKTLAQGLPLRYDPSAEDSRFLAEHRALLLSALPVGAPFDWNTCHLMNDHAKAMCQRAMEIESKTKGETK